MKRKEVVSIYCLIVTLFLSASSFAAFAQDRALYERVISIRRELDAKVGSSAPDGRIEQQIGFGRQKCHVLGIFLEKESEVNNLAFPRTLTLDSLNDYILNWYPYSSDRFAAYYLSRWIHLYDLYQDTAFSELAEIWNLDCVGNFGITSGLSQQLDAVFRVRDGLILDVLGDIEPGFYDRFSQILSENPTVEYVYLGSGGGSVADAIRAGRLIRDLGLETHLFASCYSACPIAFVGGIKRSIWFPISENLGFHRISIDGVAVDDNDRVYQGVRSYVDGMGADGNKFVELMLKARPHQIHEPDQFDLCVARIANFVRNLCISDTVTR